MTTNEQPDRADVWEALADQFLDTDAREFRAPP